MRTTCLSSVSWGRQGGGYKQFFVCLPGFAAEIIDAQTWFCDPQSPWQKGTVEKSNRRARKWLSREVYPLSVTDVDLIEICNRLNATPRKFLGYRTPAEVFRKKLLAQMRHAG